MQGNREHIDGMASGSQKVLQDVLKLIDTYDLYGSVAYPKRHQQSEISDIYRLPLATKGVFTNVALQEPFGLTVIEAWPAPLALSLSRCSGKSHVIKWMKYRWLFGFDHSPPIRRPLQMTQWPRETGHMSMLY